jgi:hypothetical protein
VYQAYARDIPQLASYVTGFVQAQLENDPQSIERRLNTVPLLRQVFRFQTVLLKLQVDRGDAPAFRHTWEQAACWARKLAAGARRRRYPVAVLGRW